MTPRYPKVGEVITVQGRPWRITGIRKGPSGRIDRYEVVDGHTGALPNAFTRAEVVGTMRPRDPNPRKDVAPAKVSQLRECSWPHGGQWNSATVYGHPWPERTCIRLAGTKTWVFDPGWEK